MKAGACDLTQKLLFPFHFISAINSNRLQHTPPFLLRPYRMAADGAGATVTPALPPIQPKPDPSVAERNHNDPSRNSSEEIPPPPEKPEPGDCCGSGCVRCVWDVYYDELEEYNKLLHKQEDPNRKP